MAQQKTKEEKAAEAEAKAAEELEKRVQEVGESDDPDELRKVIDSNKEPTEVRFAASQRLSVLDEVAAEEEEEADQEKIEEINNAGDGDVDRLREIAGDDDESAAVRLAATNKAQELTPDPPSPEEIAEAKRLVEEAKGERPDPEEAEDGWTYDPPLTPEYPLGAGYRYRDHEDGGVKLQKFDTATMDWEDEGVHDSVSDVNEHIEKQRD